MITGARQGVIRGLRGLVAFATSHSLRAFVVPGMDLARAHGLDIAACDIEVVATPRHANVLVIIGELSPDLTDAAAVAYAQMPRPRALLALGVDTRSPLPSPDVSAALTPAGLREGSRRLRSVFRHSAFRPTVMDFTAPGLEIRIRYTCPMHPEIVQDEPGNCPKCGMFLVPREMQGNSISEPSFSEPPTPDGMKHPGPDAGVEYTCPMHPEVIQDTPGQCPKCGMNLEPRGKTPTRHETHGHEHQAADVEYTCPMHPEVVQDTPGQCPKCGMNLEPREKSGPRHEGSHDHGESETGEPGFMSMIDVTRDLPRSRDGLPMDWIEVPFGPFHPGLPGGLLLSLTLDGDGVARCTARSLVVADELLPGAPMYPEPFVECLAKIDPLAPQAYRLLACRALESAAGIHAPDATERARAGAVEKDRIISHLGWLAMFGEQTGYSWLARNAAILQRETRESDIPGLVTLKPRLLSLVGRLKHTPLLAARTTGIGLLRHTPALRGPVARACGIPNDAREHDRLWTQLGFSPVTHTGSDCRARLEVRLDEIQHSLFLVEAAGVAECPQPMDIRNASGKGMATVETPRGTARLELRLEHGKVAQVGLETPSSFHLPLVPAMVEQQELGDALTAVASLDLSPWEVRA